MHSPHHPRRPRALELVSFYPTNLTAEDAHLHRDIDRHIAVRPVRSLHLPLSLLRICSRVVRRAAEERIWDGARHSRASGEPQLSLRPQEWSAHTPLQPEIQPDSLDFTGLSTYLSAYVPSSPPGILSIISDSLDTSWHNTSFPPFNTAEL